MASSLNLARSPFVNRRPLVRTGRLLAVIGAGLLIVNGVLFWRYLSSSADLRGRLREVRAQRNEESQALREIERELRSFDLENQNQRVRFLNEKIAQRSFGWSQLFEELGHVLPRDVKLYNLSPSVERRRRRRGEPQSEDWERVVLVLSGVAKETEPLLELIDGLFEHPAFQEPRLSAESRDENGQIRFELTAIYLSERDGIESTALETETRPGMPVPSQVEAVASSERDTDLGVTGADPVSGTDPVSPSERDAVRTADQGSAIEDLDRDAAATELPGAESGAGRVVPGVEPVTLEPRARREGSQTGSSQRTLPPGLPSSAPRSSSSRPGISNGARTGESAVPIPGSQSSGFLPEPRDLPSIPRPGSEDPGRTSPRPVAPQRDASSPPGSGVGR